MCCNDIFCTVCTLCDSLHLSQYQDLLYRVIISVLAPFLIFMNFTINYLTSFKLFKPIKNMPTTSLNCVLFITKSISFKIIMVNELYFHLCEYFQYYSEITHVKNIFLSHFQKNHENISHKPSPSSMRCLYKIFF